MVKNKKHRSLVKKHTQKNVRLKNQQKLSFPILLVFVAIFCGIAGYGLYNTFAAESSTQNNLYKANESKTNAIEVTKQNRTQRSDINKDGMVDRRDAPLISEAFEKKNLQADLNQDGQVNLIDMEIFRSEYQK